MDKLNFRDVTHQDFKSRRSTNPLSPIYMHRFEGGILKELG